MTPVVDDSKALVGIGVVDAKCSLP